MYSFHMCSNVAATLAGDDGLVTRYIICDVLPPEIRADIVRRDIYDLVSDVDGSQIDGTRITTATRRELGILLKKAKCTAEYKNILAQSTVFCFNYEVKMDGLYFFEIFYIDANGQLFQMTISRYEDNNKITAVTPDDSKKPIFMGTEEFISKAEELRSSDQKYIFIPPPELNITIGSKPNEGTIGKDVLTSSLGDFDDIISALPSAAEISQLINHTRVRAYKVKTNTETGTKSVSIFAYNSNRQLIAIDSDENGYFNRAICKERSAIEREYIALLVKYGYTFIAEEDESKERVEA